MGRPGRVLAAIPGALLQAIGALVVAFALGRALYYPFWAAQAAEVELARSWGGPGAVGATLVHWLVAAALAFAGLALIRLGTRWRRRHAHRRSAR